MLRVLIAALALTHTDPAAWRAGWDHAKARTEIRARWRHREIDAAAYIRLMAAHQTPQERADVNKVLKAWEARLDALHQQTLDKERWLQEELSRRRQQRPPK